MPRLVEPGTLVLIVDDDVSVREGIADALLMEGYGVQPLPSVEAALAQLATGVRPSLAIVDLWLPGIGSRAFVRHLRSFSNARIPVLMVSGEESLHHMELGADAALRKPFEMTTLVRAVDKLTRTARAGRPTAPQRRAPRRATRTDRHSATQRRHGSASE